MAKKNTKLAATENTEIQEFEGFGEEAGAGLEDLGKEDLKAAFVTLLQSNSRPVQHGLAQFGQWWHSGLEQAFDTIYIVPAAKTTTYVEWWKKGNSRGEQGFVAKHEENSDFVRKAKARHLKETGRNVGKIALDADRELVETREVVAVVIDPEGNFLGGAVVPFKSTAIKPWVNICTKINQRTVTVREGSPPQRVPLYCTLLKCESEKKENEHGVFQVPRLSYAESDFCNTRFNGVLSLKNPWVISAKELRKMVHAGEIEVDYSKEEAATEEDREVPF